MRDLADRRSLPVWGLIVCAGLLAAQVVADNDAYTHLSFGRLFLELGGLPDTEPFAYPVADRPLNYTSWLFGWTAYLLLAQLGAWSLVWMKMVCALATVWLMALAATNWRNNWPWVWAIVIPLYLVLIHGRVSLRPELWSNVLLAATLLVLVRYAQSGRRSLLYWLPLIGLIWGNSHSSVVLFPALCLALLTVNPLQFLLYRKGWSEVPALASAHWRFLLLMSAVSVLASMLSPYTHELYTYAMEVHGTRWYSRFIFELGAPVGAQLWAVVGILVGWIWSLWLNRSRLMLLDVVVVVPFGLAALTAVRYGSLLAIIAGFVMLRNVVQAVPLNRIDGRWRAAFGGMVLVIVALFGHLGYQKDVRLKPFGFELAEPRKYAQAARFLEEAGIEGRLLNQFNTGAYLIWTGYPQRRVFLDPRGYLPEDLLYDSMEFPFAGDILDSLYQRYRFEAIIVDNPWTAYGSDRRPMGYPALRSGDWALVYWDDYQLVYLRRGGLHSTHIANNEYRVFRPDLPFVQLQSLVSGLGDGREVEQELQRSIAVTPNAMAYAFLGMQALNRRAYDRVDSLAREGERAVGSTDPGIRRFLSEIRGIAALRAGDGRTAEQHFLAALEWQDDAALRTRLAQLHVSNRDDVRARSQLEAALQVDRNYRPALELLLSISRRQGDLQAVEWSRTRLSELAVEHETEQQFAEAVRLHGRGDRATAVARLRAILKGQPNHYRALVRLGHIEIELGNQDEATRILNHAIDMEPDGAPPYYLLAHMALAAEDLQSAKTNYQTFLDYTEANDPWVKPALAAIEEINRRESAHQ